MVIFNSYVKLPEDTIIVQYGLWVLSSACWQLNCNNQTGIAQHGQRHSQPPSFVDNCWWHSSSFWSDPSKFLCILLIRIVWWHPHVSALYTISAGWIQYCAVLPSCSATSILWFLVSSTPKLASKINRSNAGKSMNVIIFTGWWFGTFFLYFPFHIWDVILPIDELIFFRGKPSGELT